MYDNFLTALPSYSAVRFARTTRLKQWISQRRKLREDKIRRLH
ncbi:unnamed protein product [Brassica oleracea]